MKSLVSKSYQFLGALLLTSIFALNAVASPLLERVYPEKVGISSTALSRADSAIYATINEGQIPGGVLAVVRHGKLAYLKAYGYKQLVPTKVKMTDDTIFDLASVTKPLSTGISTMLLLERGQLLLQDKVQRYLEYWPEENKITIRHLLTHTSGLPAYAPVATLASKAGDPRKNLEEYIAEASTKGEPGEKFRYSCLNFVTLQYIVESITGTTLDEFAMSQIFRPMGLKNTGYRPSGEKLLACAPTEVQKETGKPLLGVVHDPLARVLNKGVSGNAGLFSTAEEVAAICTMLLNHGRFHGRQIMSPAAVEAFTTVPVGYEFAGRTLGWDANSPYSSNNGNLSSRTSYGHTGYTGTSVSVDPDKDMAVVFLSNRVHPQDTTSTTRLMAVLKNILSGGIYQDDVFNNLAEHYFSRLETFSKEAPITSNDVVMLGNSLTEGGRDWNERIPGAPRIVNRGIIGDTSAGILFRLDEITKAKPKKIFLLIGVNDVSHNMSAEDITRRIGYILDYIKTETPETKVYLQTLLPIDESFNRYKNLTNKTHVIPQINTILREMAQERGLTLIDLYPHFLDKNGKTLKKSITNDGLHLKKEGYDIWVKQIKPHILGD